MISHSIQCFHARETLANSSDLGVQLIDDSTYRGVCIKVATHVFYLELELMLTSVFRALSILISLPSRRTLTYGLRTLKARCSKKCAVPLVLSVSALLPASIHTPTVDVCAQGECSVAICKLIS